MKVRLLVEVRETKSETEVYNRVCPPRQRNNKETRGKAHLEHANVEGAHITRTKKMSQVRPSSQKKIVIRQLIELTGNENDPGVPPE